MDFREKVLYHQIYPGKLMADVSASVLSLYFFWRHKPVAALLTMFLPPIIASWIIIQRVDLEKYKHSALGKYLNTYMTRQMEALRMAGNIPMIIGAWYHKAWLMSVGVIMVLFGWLRGVLFPKTSRA